MKIRLSFLYPLSLLALCAYSNTYSVENQHRLNKSNPDLNYVVDKLYTQERSVTDIINTAHKHLKSIKLEDHKQDMHFFFIVRMLATIAAKDPETLVQQYFGRKIEGSFSDEFYELEFDKLPSNNAKLGYCFAEMVLNLRAIQRTGGKYTLDNFHAQFIYGLLHEDLPGWFKDLTEKYKLFDFLKALGVFKEKTSTNNTEQEVGQFVSFANAMDITKKSILGNKSHIIKVHFDLKKMTKNQPAQQKEDKAAEDILFKAFGSNLAATRYYWAIIPEMITIQRHLDYYKSEQLEKLIGIRLGKKTNNLYEDLVNVNIGKNLFSIVNYFVFLCIVNNKLDVGINEPENFIKNHNKFIEAGFWEKPSQGEKKREKLTEDGKTIINLANFIIKSFQAKELLACFKNKKNYKEEKPNKNEEKNDKFKYKNKPTKKNFGDGLSKNGLDNKDNKIKGNILSIYYTPELRQIICNLAKKNNRCKAIDNLLQELDKKDTIITKIPEEIQGIVEQDFSKFIQDLGLNDDITVLNETTKWIDDLSAYVNDVCYKDTILIEATIESGAQAHTKATVLERLGNIEDRSKAISIASGPVFYILDDGKLKKAGIEDKEFKELTGKDEKKQIGNISHILITRKNREVEEKANKYVANIHDFYKIIEDIKEFAKRTKKEEEIKAHTSVQAEAFKLESLTDVINRMIYLDDLIDQKHEGLKWLARHLREKKQKFEEKIEEKLDRFTNKLFDVLQEVNDILTEENQTDEGAKAKVKNVIGKYTKKVVIESLELAVNIDKVISRNGTSMHYLLQGFEYKELKEIFKIQEPLQENYQNNDFKLKSSKSSNDRNGTGTDSSDVLGRNSGFKQNNTRQNTQGSDIPEMRRQTGQHKNSKKSFPALEKILAKNNTGGNGTKPTSNQPEESGGEGETKPKNPPKENSNIPKTQQQTEQSESFKNARQSLEGLFANNSTGGNADKGTRNQPGGFVGGGKNQPKNPPEEKAGKPQSPTTSGGDVLPNHKNTVGGAGSRQSSGEDENGRTQPAKNTGLFDDIKNGKFSLKPVEPKKTESGQNSTEEGGVIKGLKETLQARRKDVAGGESSSDDTTEDD